MSQMNDIFENHVLAEAFVKTSPYTKPSAVFIGLFRGDPGETGVITSECTGGSYARLNITSLMSNPSGGFINNSTDILFAQATANWGDITHIGILNSNTLGTGIMCVYASLSATVTINNNEQFRINASNLTFQAL
jgi:hypothetical protein